MEETLWQRASVRRQDAAEDLREAEEAFLHDYRRAGLMWAAYACAVAAVLIALFIFVPGLSLADRFAPHVLGTRAGMVTCLMLVLFVLLRRRDFSIRYYPVVIGSGCVVLLAGITLLVAEQGMVAASAGMSPLPVVLFALFLSYSLLRLPLWLAIGIGAVFSTTVLLVVYGDISAPGAARSLVYVVAFNLLGAFLLRSTEARERDLFLQRRRAEAAQIELDRRARAAEEADREKTRLLAAVSHDLRQPIMASLTFVDVLKNKLDKQDYAQVRRQAEHITSSIQMLGATLDHLLTAARYDSGTEPIRIEAVDLGVVLERLQLAFIDEARTRGLELRVRMPRRRLIVTSDATALWRVLMNLVANGLKFTPPDAARRRGVVVSATLRGGTCHVHVVDTGIGIAREHQELIWQPYMQLANEERNRQRGLGLGLFLVRRALDRVPGHAIALRSAPGRGSRFTVTMPGLWVGEPAPLHQGEVRLAESDLALMRGAHVLVIEDDRDARRAFQELFDDWGVLYSSGATLEEVLRDNESAELDVDAIVTDYRLPGARNGVECIVELRRVLATEAPAIVVTGEADLAPIGRALPGRTTLLQKPFDTLALAAPLIEAIRLARGGERA